MSTLSFIHRAALGDQKCARRSRCRSQLLRFAGNIHTASLELREGLLLPLTFKLQSCALEVEELLEFSFASTTSEVQRTYLSLVLETVRKRQEALDHALENGLLLPEHFLELNADWECLGRRMRSYERNLS